MPLIDPEGMFGGDRMAKLSDTAKLYWPWFYSASNGFGRMELNYRKLRDRAFSGFKNPPSEEEFRSMIREYRAAYLLFIYISNGQYWGQWDTSERYLPHYKTAYDQRSPEPPPEAWIRWKERYAALKAAQTPCVSLFSEKLEKAEQNFHIGIGVVEGIVIGKEKPLCASADALVEEIPRCTNGAKPRTPSEKWFHEEFWPIVWAKIGKDFALTAWKRKVKDEQTMRAVVAAAKTQGPSIIERGSRPGCSVLHPATWLNQGRWKDEFDYTARKKQEQEQQFPPPIDWAARERRNG